MSIRIEDLPPAAQAQARRQIAEQEAGRSERILVQKQQSENASLPAEPKPSKYRNKKATRTVALTGVVLTFDSQKEARRYDELLLMAKAGEIREMKLQPSFTLSEAYTDAETGYRVQAIRYQADFQYLRKTNCAQGPIILPQWEPVVEDVKSKATKTRLYTIKKKLMKERFGIDISEV